MIKFFKKFTKLYFGAILGPICPNFGIIEFSKKKEFCQFLNISITIVPLCQKSEKTNESFLRKMLNCWADIHTTVILQNPPSYGAPIIKTTLNFLKFISAHQQPVYSINSFVRYSACQSQSGTTTYDHSHPNIFESIFNFNKFVITCKKKDRLFNHFTVEIYLI